ncbi:universal stress protein [Nocardioides sp. W3-2-3]|nr:universal stress protein [Nocardioides convexus]
MPVTQRVNHGLVDDVIGSRTGAWDLVVVGRHPLDSVSRLVIGSIATAVTERAQTNVAVVPVDREQAPGVTGVAGRARSWSTSGHSAARHQGEGA